MYILLLAITLLIFVGTVVFLRAADANWRHFYHPFLLLGGVMLLYTVTPLFDAEIRASEQSLLDRFMLMQLFAMVGLASGTVTAQFVMDNDGRRDGSVLRSKRHVFVLWSSLALGLGTLLYVFETSLGGIGGIFMHSYRYMIDSMTDRSTREFLIWVLAIYCFPVLIGVILLSGRLRSAALFCALVYCALNLGAGARNQFVAFAGMLLICWSLCRDARISYFKLCVAGAAGLVALQFVGLFRNFGFAQTEDLTDLLFTHGATLFNPSSQELNTSFNVFRINDSLPLWSPFAPGESYLVAFLGLIPKFIWSGRPDAICSIFSGRFAEYGVGLGFSNNLEAYVNGGYGAVVIVNCLLGFISNWIVQKYVVRQLGFVAIGYYINLMFLAFNWNRIDFQTVLKISVIQIGTFWILAQLLLEPTQRIATKRNFSR